MIHRTGVPPVIREKYLKESLNLGKSYIILTDSGGVQEEAPSLGKPVLVMRDVTERIEGIQAGTAKIVGTNMDRIISEVLQLLNNRNEYEVMAKSVNPYGDGKAGSRIRGILGKVLIVLNK